MMVVTLLLYGFCAMVEQTTDVQSPPMYNIHIFADPLYLF